jgi:hypothetical protein
MNGWLKKPIILRKLENEYTGPYEFLEPWLPQR